MGTTMLIMQPALLQLPWMHAKLGAVLLLLGYHAFAARVYRRFAAGDYILTESQCRYWSVRSLNSGTDFL